IVQLVKSPSIGLPHSVAGDMAAQRILKAKVPEVDRVISRVGADELGLDPMGLNETDTFVTLKPQSEWHGSKEAIIEDMRH
ncbi:efflux RND transporter permease subunit, partial [Pasteurella multocida]|uniref:efflux RND transporter permease subunit n=1 Tax=Pasteurella multocida TaxID=747 RepID=UPI0035E41FFB